MQEVEHYLTLEKGQFFDVDFSSLDIDKKFMLVQHEEDDAEVLKKHFDEATKKLQLNSHRSNKLSARSNLLGSSRQSPEKKAKLNESLSEDDREEEVDYMQIPEEGKLITN